MKGDIDDEANMKYLQVFQHIATKETVAYYDTEAVKKVGN